MKKRIFTISALILSGFWGAFISYSAEFASDNVRIIQEKKSYYGKQAGSFLKKHLELIAGKELAPGEDAYKIILREKDLGNKGTWVTGDGETVITGKGRLLRYAVSDFLEKQLGIVWMDYLNTAYKERKTIILKNTDGFFIDRYAEHFIWARRGPQLTWAGNVKSSKFISWNTSHAFIYWWHDFGKKYPQFFSMKENGVRGPRNSYSNSMNVAAAAVSKNRRVNNQVQLCVSNKDLPDFIIEQHLKSKKASKEINLSNNDDASSYCRCPECKKLDVKRPGIPEWPHISDRYLLLSNKVAEKAAKLKPARNVHFLAYCETEEPPAKTRVASNILVTFCPTDYRLERTLVQLDNWIKMGARKIRMRPNLPCYFHSSLPIGFEKHAWKLFSETMKRPEVVGCNIDNLSAVNLGTFSFPMYVIARTIVSPETPFEVWEKEYLTGYGEGAADVRKYFEVWRNVWDKKINPDYENILKQVRYFNIGVALLRWAKKYYTIRDFDQAETHLKNALEKDLTEAERKRVEELILVNTHARLIYLAASTNGVKQSEYARKLIDFRKKHPVIMGYQTKNATDKEGRWGDFTGIKKAAITKEFDLPVMPTPIFWYFKIDPKRVGEKEKWYETSFDEFRKWGEMAPTHTYWQGTPRMPNMSAAMKKRLITYDGVGWFARNIAIPVSWKERQVFLLFGAVDEACKVFVNGKLVHTRKYERPRDESRPFSVDITRYIDWKRPTRNLVHVMVIDETGQGGITQRVYLVSRKIKKSSSGADEKK